jgi:predicted nucleotidyltransferase
MDMMSVDDSMVQEIVRRLLNVTKPDRIILFGSAASGTMNRAGDVDLLVVAKAPSNTVAE